MKLHSGNHIAAVIFLSLQRFEVLEPAIYESNARQSPKSPEWFMSGE